MESAEADTEAAAGLGVNLFLSHLGSSVSGKLTRGLMVNDTAFWGEYIGLIIELCIGGSLHLI